MTNVFRIARTKLFHLCLPMPNPLRSRMADQSQNRQITLLSGPEPRLISGTGVEPAVRLRQLSRESPAKLLPLPDSSSQPRQEEAAEVHALNLTRRNAANCPAACPKGVLPFLIFLVILTETTLK